MKERSKSAIICERIAKRVVVPKGKTLTEAILNYRKMKGKKKYKLPFLMKIQEKVDDVISRDMQLFYMNTESTGDKLIIYLHGGAYVEEMLGAHWLMLDKITSKVDATFIIPDYPLAPYSDFEDCYDKMTVFYQKILKYYPDRKIIIMGDSAGGGLALGLSMFFKEKGLPVPDQLILLSPWIDLTMSNPQIKDYKKIDPTLKPEELIVDAKYWANGKDLKDYRLSPVYGKPDGLKDVTIFVGTHECFYPDIVSFSKRLKEADIKNRLFIGEGLDHVYPAFPIPEAEEAIEKICKIINDQGE